jgi:hypothetical protein
MNNVFRTLWRTTILDDAAYQAWQERPNLFLRGIVLVVAISLVAGLVTFGVNLVNRVRPVDVARIDAQVQNAIDQQFRMNPGLQNMDPQARQMVDQTIQVIIPMVNALVNVQTPLPHAVAGFFEAVGGWLTAGLAALGGWLLYGALVLIVVNLLGGSARLPDFLGMVSLYAIPGLLGLFGPIPCAGALLALIGTIWGIVIYIKAVTVVAKLDTGRAVLAVFAPAVILVLLAILLAILAIIWLVIIF